MKLALAIVVGAFFWACMAAAILSIAIGQSFNDFLASIFGR